MILRLLIEVMPEQLEIEPHWRMAKLKQLVQISRHYITSQIP